MAEAGRVIAGTARGLRLVAPGEGTRPLADRVKQTLFAILEPDLPGAVVLDLFAGSGAGGIEALSRGAAKAVFVEHGAAAIKAIATNLGRTHFEAAAVVVKSDVISYLSARAASDGPFDFVLVDPPFADLEVMRRTLQALGTDATATAPEAWVVARYFWRDAPSDRIGLLASVRTRRFGETGMTFYRRGSGDPEEAAR